MSEKEKKELPEDKENFNGSNGEENSTPEQLHKMLHLSGMYQNWFLDYASYVILERAVPHVVDGLKPVQRRILHSMRRLEDGRYNKVANLIGHTMQFHPHGDASIGDALVQLGQKNLLVDTQGNWGNLLTGDSAAASRYIEARLSKFALDVVFNPKTTDWKLSYDGRNKEPITLPVKFPLLLAQGVEGIAVGLSSKILPHNFNELIDASIDYLKGKNFQIFPDFPTGGLIDVARYNNGSRGGMVRVRAKISKLDRKTLVVTEIPYGKNTTSLIDSILKANEKGKIKIKKIDDNTSENVEILIHLAPGISPDKTIDALYAFSDCEVPISPNCCIIEDDKPRFMGVDEALKISSDHTLDLLKKELEIRKAELEEQWHFSSLEKIFIENRIYRDIEECETWESIIQAIDKGLEPFKKKLLREVTEEDIVKLTEIKIKRISKFDSKKADEMIKDIEKEVEEVQGNLNNIVNFTIDYFKRIKKKYGGGRERKTEIKSFETIVASKVVEANQKLYGNLNEGFVGTSLKKDEYICDCSDIDDILVIRSDGTYIITKVSEKSFVGKDIIHIAVFKKNDKRTIYNLVYRDGMKGNIMIKRCAITGITRDKEYTITKGSPGSKILYFSANPNGEAEVIKVYHKPRPRLRNLVIEADFGEIAIKGKNSIGNILTRYGIHKIVLKEKGESTLGGRKIWYDEDVQRLNTEERGTYLGEFFDKDRILIITKSGDYRLSVADPTIHFEDDLRKIEKFNPEKVMSVVYFDASQDYFYAKRFQFDPTERLTPFIDDSAGSRVVLISEEKYPRVKLIFGGKHEYRQDEIIDLTEFIGIKGVKARGKRLTTYQLSKIEEIEPLHPEEETPGDKLENEDPIEGGNNEDDNDNSQMSLNL